MRPTSSDHVIFIHVEDDDVDAESFRRACRKAGLGNPVIRYSDGAAAWRALKSNQDVAAQEPYILLIDLNLPRMNGLELLRQLRGDPEFRKSIVYVLTTSGHEQDVAAAYDQQVAGYICKSRVGGDLGQVVSLLNRQCELADFPIVGTP